MKQTAVDWLASEINSRGPKENNPPQWLQELYEQAKAMEKEQMFSYTKQRQVIGENSMKFFTEDFEQYYNETYETI